MSIGRLTGLDSQVSTVSDSSVSCTIPSGGSVAVGDLLIVASSISSGVRTLALTETIDYGSAFPGASTFPSGTTFPGTNIATIPGADIGWTDLGRASITGHTSEVWWKIATSDDMGSIVTITPSTGLIRQLVMLSVISGADQAYPFGSPLSVLGSATTSSATTKTSPSLTTSSAVAREVTMVFDSQPSATNTTWTQPSGFTLVTSADTTAGGGATSGAIADIASTGTGAMGGRVWTADIGAQGSTWTLAVAEAPSYVVTSDDTVGVTDGFVLDGILSYEEDLGLVDDLVFDLVLTIEDPVDVTDDTIEGKEYANTEDDAADVTDDVATNLFKEEVSDDPVGVTDSTALVYDGIREPSDTANVTDSLAVFQSYVKADNVDVTDSVNTVLSTGNLNPRSIRPLYGLTIVLFDSSGTKTMICPDFTDVTWTDEISTTGTIGIKYPTQGLNASSLMNDRTEGAIFWGDVELPGTRFLVSEQARDPLDEAGGIVTINAPAWVGKRLSEAVVYPQFWPTRTPMSVKFTNATPGAIMLKLINQAHIRGALTGLTVDFNETVDSNGVAWQFQVSAEFNVGTDYMSILSKLLEMTVVDWRGNGRVFQMYNFGGMGTDQTAGDKPVILYSGRDMEDAPVNRSVLDLVTVVLSAGDEAAIVERENASAVTEYGVIEGYVSSSGITDTGTLNVIGDATVQQKSHAQEEYTHKLVFVDSTSPVPYVDYFVGDKVYRAVDGLRAAYLVRQLTFEYNADGDITASITLNDKLYTQDILMQRRINALMNGSSATASSPGDSSNDKVPTNAPTDVSLVSSAYGVNGGGTYAAVQASWTPPGSNTDGSAVTDLDHYETQWKYSFDTDASYSSSLISTDPSVQWSAVNPNAEINVRVRAVDQSGNISAWSSVATATTAYDDTPPPVPSTPVVTSPQTTLRALWDGLGSVGEQMPLDFQHVEVHVSVVDNFTPDSTTVVDYLPAAGASVLTGLDTGVTYYVKFISVDISGNKSDPSAEGSTVISGISLGDTQFRDQDNLIDDGSFESAASRATREATGGFAYDNTFASNGSWSLKMTFTDGLTHPFALGTDIPATSNDVFYWRYYVRRDSAANGSLVVTRTYHLSDGSTTTFTSTVASTSILANTWTMTPGVTDGTSTPPANTVSLDLSIGVSGQTLGNWWVDQVELRHVIGTALIQDLAVTNAKIASVSAGKITVGTLIADITVSSRIKTADTGARVELSGAGLFAYDSSNNQTVSLSATTGQISALGTFSSGAVNSNQVKLSSSGPWGDPSLWFSQPAKAWGFSPTVYSPVADGSLRIISAEKTQNSSGRSQLWLFTNHFELTSPFTNSSAALATIDNPGGVFVTASNSGSGVDVQAGLATSNSSMGVVGLKGKLPAGFYNNSLFLQWRGSMTYGSSGAAGSSTSTTLTWGPTLIGSLRFVISASRGSGATADNVTGWSSTTVSFRSYAVQSGTSSCNMHVLGWAG